MSGKLAFDRDAIDVLRIHLQGAINELDRAIGSDTAAAAARTRARRAIWAMEPWRARLSDISGCGVLFGYTPVGPDRGDLTDMYFAMLAGGRTMVADPLSALAGMQDVDAIAKARALAQVLREGDLDDFVSTAEERWLIKQLTDISTSRDASQIFMRELGAVRVTELIDGLIAPALTNPGLVHEPTAAGKIPPIFEALDALGAVVATFRQAVSLAERADWDTQLLDAETLGLLRIVRAGVNVPGAWTDREVLGIAAQALEESDPRSGDDPLTPAVGSEAIWLLSERPLAGQQFLESADEQLLEDVLFRYDARARSALLLETSDPNRFTPEQVGPSMRMVALALMTTEISLGKSMTDPATGAPLPLPLWPPTGAEASGFLVPPPSMPPSLGTYFGRYLPEIMEKADARVDQTDWTNGIGVDHSRLHQLIGQEAPEMAALRLWSEHFLAESLRRQASAEHIASAAYIVAAIDDVRRFLGVNEVESRRANAEALATLAGLRLPPVTGLFAGLGTDKALDEFGLDVRDAIAQSDAAGFEMSVAITATTLGVWSSQHPRVPSPPLPPPPPTKVPSAGDRVNAQVEMYDESLEVWLEEVEASTASPAEADEAEDLVRRLRLQTSNAAGYASAG